MIEIYGLVTFSTETRWLALGVGLKYINNFEINDSSSMWALVEKGQLEEVNSFSVKRSNEYDIFEDGRRYHFLYPFQSIHIERKIWALTSFEREQKDRTLPSSLALPTDSSVRAAHAFKSFLTPAFTQTNKNRKRTRSLQLVSRNKEDKMITNKESVQYANLADRTKQFTFSTDIHRDTSSLHSLGVVLFAWYTQTLIFRTSTERGESAMKFGNRENRKRILRFMTSTLICLWISALASELHVKGEWKLMLSEFLEIHGGGSKTSQRPT